jgi:mannose-1-phosphate guanylyltransferase
MDYVAVMAGGSGTRLWPLSRRMKPKQFLDLGQGISLLQLAHGRARRLVGDDRIVVCASVDHRALVRDQLPGLMEGNLFSEPVGRNSLAAISWTVALLVDRDPQAVVAILSSDHLIAEESVFTEVVTHGMNLVAKDNRVIVTCGVVPTTAHTGYGYLRLGKPHESQVGFVVEEFAEKPSVDQAQQYVDRGWLWNSGTFIFHGQTFLDQVGILEPQLSHAIDKIVAEPSLLAEVYPTLTCNSVDYALMEPISAGKATASIVALPLETQWSDVGSFATFEESLRTDQMNADDRDNILQGPVISLDSSGNLVVNRDTNEHLVAVCGVEDLIVIHDQDLTVVCPKNQVDSLSQVRAKAQERGDYG